MGNHLKQYRLAQGLKQTQVAAGLKEVDTRADSTLLSKYECGVCLPTRAQLSALERCLQADRTELYDVEDLDLLELTTQPASVQSERAVKTPPPSHLGRYRKCYRISQELAESLPNDLLAVCGFNSWQSWHDSMLRHLLAEYETKKGARGYVGVGTERA